MDAPPEHGQPGPQHGQPGTEHGQPGTEHGQPGTEHGQPGTEHRQRRQKDPEPEREDLTQLLARMRAGEADAREQLYGRSFEQLRRYAQRLLGHQNGHTLQPTALVGEAWLRLANGKMAPEAWQDRRHFIGSLARAMRSVVVDHERRRRTLRREPPGSRIDLDEAHAQYQERAEDLVGLDEALEELGKTEPALVKIVELRFFLGLTVNETAALLGVTRRTVERRFERARSLLYRGLSERASLPTDA
ncbi:MAG: ECF-type sigma factor [Planctomycetota bacterium]